MKLFRCQKVVQVQKITKTICLQVLSVVDCNDWHVVMTQSSVETSDRHALSHDHLSLFGHCNFNPHKGAKMCLYFKVTVVA